MPPRKRLRAEATFRARPDGSRPDTRVPAEVRDFFGAGDSDRLIFEDGCAETVERAALAGPYVVVRLAARPGALPAPRVVKPEAVHAPPPPPEAPPVPTPALEPFDVAVKRYREERRR